jgi:ABC-type Mn2+/Zn2+ transport system permease subunit
MFDFLGEPFMRYALASGVLVGGLCAFLGVFLVLRRMVFVAVALSELAACGVALGLWLNAVPSVCAIALCLGGIGLLVVPGRDLLVSREGLVGSVYAIGAALALILMALNPMAHARGVDLFAGDLLYTQDEHVITLLGLVTATVLGAVFYLRKLLFSFFDQEMAHSLGLPARRIELGFLFLVALVIALSLRVAGVVFVFASLVLPAVFGLALGRRIVPALVLSVIGAVLASIMGLYASYHFEEEIPSAPAIVIAYGVLALLGVSIRAVIESGLVGGALRGWPSPCYTESRERDRQG